MVCIFRHFFNGEKYVVCAGFTKKSFLTLDGCLAIHDVKVIQGYDRLFVGMPSRKYDTYDFRDVVHPISQDVRQNLEKIVLDAYNDYVAEFQP